MSVGSLKFPSRMFRGAAIYGVLVLAPMYAIAAPADRADTYYGFIGCALVFQWLFWIIGGNPRRFRLGLAAQGRAPLVVVPFAIMDLLLGTGFIIARNRTPA